MTSYQYTMDSPIGPLTLVESNNAISALYIHEKPKHQKEVLDPALCPVSKTLLLSQAITELNEYFEQKRKRFTLPLAPSGTEFQKRCWNALLSIPYGETRSYKDIAIAIGNEKACRAVGMANHKNPISILIPCHRVIGTNGSLIGYGGGLPVKEYLLKLEGSMKSQ